MQPFAGERVSTTAQRLRRQTQRGQLSDYKKELDQFNRVETEYKQLQQSVDVDRQNYRLYLTKFEESRISDAMDSEKIAGVTLIEPAQVPLKPVSPKKMLNLVLGLFLGALGGLGLAYGLLDIEGFNLVLAGALFSIILNPLAFAAVDQLSAWIRSRPQLNRRFEEQRATGLEQVQAELDAARAQAELRAAAIKTFTPEELAAQFPLFADLTPEQREALVLHFQPYTAERPTEIVVDNEASSFFTIVEVVTFDFPGLLFRVADALFKCGLDIWVAKIATKVDQVVDVFYIRDFDGQKVDAPHQVAAVKAAIQEILPGEDPKKSADRLNPASLERSDSSKGINQLTMQGPNK